MTASAIEITFFGLFYPRPDIQLRYKETVPGNAEAPENVSSSSVAPPRPPWDCFFN